MIARDGDHSPTFDGLVDYRKDVDRAWQEFPGIQLLFAPELGSRSDLDTVPSSAVEISDFFLCEVPMPGSDVEENTRGYEPPGRSSPRALDAVAVRSEGNR